MKDDIYVSKMGRSVSGNKEGKIIPDRQNSTSKSRERKTWHVLEDYK